MNRAKEDPSFTRPLFFLPAQIAGKGRKRVYYAVHGERGPWVIAYTLGNEETIYISAIHQRMAKSARLILIRWPQTGNLKAAVRGGAVAMDTLDAKSAVWYGTSVGGAIAQTANTITPKHVSAMILANTALPVPWAEILARFAALVTNIVPEAMLRKKLLKATNSSPDAEEAKAASVLLKKRDICNWLKWAADFHALNIRRMKKDNREKPILIIETDNDPGVPFRHREKLKAFYPTSSVRCFEGAGHFPHILFPNEYAESVTQFLHDLSDEADLS